MRTLKRLFSLTIIIPILLTASLSCQKKQLLENCIDLGLLEFEDICGDVDPSLYQLWNYGQAHTVRNHSTTARRIVVDSFTFFIRLHFNKSEFLLTESVLEETFFEDGFNTPKKSAFNLIVECNGVKYTNIRNMKWPLLKYEEVGDLSIRDVYFDSYVGNCINENKIAEFGCTVNGILLSENDERLAIDDMHIRMQIKHN